MAAKVVSIYFGWVGYPSIKSVDSFVFWILPNLANHLVVASTVGVVIHLSSKLFHWASSKCNTTLREQVHVKITKITQFNLLFSSSHDSLEQPIMLVMKN